MAESVMFKAVTVNTTRRLTLGILWTIGIAVYFVVPFLMMVNFLERANTSQWQWATDLRIGLLGYLLFLATSVAMHEGLHCLAFFVYSGHAQMGIKWWTRTGPVCFATAAGQKFTKWQYIQTCLAPQLLTVACLTLVMTVTMPAPLWVWLLIVGTGNLAGGVFDMYAVVKVSQLPKHAKIEDVKDGWKVYLPA